MGRGVSSGHPEYANGTSEIGTGENCPLRWTRFGDRNLRFRERLLPSDHGSAFQKQRLDCYYHDHRFAGAETPLQRPRYDDKFELDAANPKKRRATARQPKRTKTNAIDSRTAWENDENLIRGLRRSSQIRLAKKLCANLW